jgi:glycosyltransferase involved in cell wall biosynthesis
MPANNLLIISNTFPDRNGAYFGDVFVKEQLRYIKEYFDSVIVVSPVPYGLERLRHTAHENYHYDNVSVYFPKYFNLPIFYWYGRRIWTFLAARAVLSLLKEKGISVDLIHAHMTWPSGAVAISLKERLDVPVVITEHTSTTFRTAAEKHDRYWARILNASDAIIRVRKGDTDQFKAFGVAEDKIHVITNGFDADQFFPRSISESREQLGLPEDKIILLYVGALYDPVKGHRFLIDAISQIVHHRQDILGVVVGSGKLEGSLRNQIEKLNVEQFVHLVGGRPHSEIPLWMNAADLFVLPSLNEGNPTVMFEALGCGKPFVGTRVGGVPEVITSKEYGLLVAPGDATELAEKIMLALEMDWDHELILHYAAQYSWKIIGQQIAYLYSKVLSSK